jgi:hypothetical protein
VHVSFRAQILRVGSWGVVRDESGAVLAGVTATLESPALPGGPIRTHNHFDVDYWEPQGSGTSNAHLIRPRPCWSRFPAKTRATNSVFKDPLRILISARLLPVARDRGVSKAIDRHFESSSLYQKLRRRDTIYSNALSEKAARTQTPRYPGGAPLATKAWSANVVHCIFAASLMIYSRHAWISSRRYSYSRDVLPHVVLVLRPTGRRALAASRDDSEDTRTRL